MATESKDEQAPLVVVLTGAAGNIAYALSFMIAQGSMFGNRQVDLRLLDIPQCVDRLEATGMELVDSASRYIANLVTTTDYEAAFTDADIALLVGARPRGKGMLRSDLLQANAAIFEGQGKAIDEFAKKTVKVLVVGNPANTNALITMTNAPSIPRENFSALTRLDQNRGTALLAGMLDVRATDVSPIIVWGNHSSTQFPDARMATVKHPSFGDAAVSVASALASTALFADHAAALEWLHGAFIETIQQRGAAVINKRGASSAGSAANAICDHMRDWMSGTDGRIVSMAVATNGTWYGLPEGLVFSLPVTVDSDGKYQVVEDFTTVSTEHPRIAATLKELLHEKEIALASAAAAK